MRQAWVFVLLSSLAGPQDRLAPILERWRTGPEEERLRALSDASHLREQVGEAALSKFAEPPVPSAWVRADALLEVVSGAKVPAWYDLLPPLLSNRDPSIRARTLEEFAGRGFRRFACAALPLLKDSDRRVSWQAAYTLIEMGSVELVPQIAALLKDPEQSVRPNVLYLLGRLGSREHGPLLAPLLDDPDPAVARAAIQSLGRFKARDYSAQVARFLASSDPGLRQAAVAALAGMGARDQADKIAELLSDTETLIRWEAIRALGALRARDYAGQIVAAVDEDGGLAPALEAMGALGLRELSPHILPYLRTPDPGIRWRAVKALGDIDAKDDVESVARMLKDDDSFVRLCALQALAALGAQDRAGAMLTLLRDEDSEVCQGAAEEASLLAGPEQILQVSALVGETDAFVRWNALHLLVGAGARDALPKVLSRLQGAGGADGDALWAVGRLGGPEQAEEVAKALGNEDGRIRQQAAFALARISARPELLEAAELRSEGAPRLALGFALIRMGRKKPGEAGMLLKEYLLHQGEPGYELFPDEVCDALAAGFEKGLSSALTREFRTSRRIESTRSLEVALKPLGISLADGLPDLRRRLPAGSKVTARRLLEWSFGRDVRIVPDHGRFMIVDAAGALEYWQKRLDAP